MPRMLTLLGLVDGGSYGEAWTRPEHIRQYRQREMQLVRYALT